MAFTQAMLSSLNNGGSNIGVTPAPKLSYDPNGFTMQKPLSPPVSPSAVTSSNDTTGTLSGLGKNLMSDYSNAIPNFLKAAGSGTANPNTAGGFATDVGEGALRSTSSALQTIFSPISEGIKSLGHALGNSPTLQSVVQNPAVSNTLDFFNNVGGKLDSWAQAHPQAAQDLGAAINVGGAAIGGAGEGAVNEVASNAAQGTVNAVSNAASELGEGISSIGSGGSSNEEVLTNAENTRQQVATSNVKAAQDIKSQVDTHKASLGDQFQKSAEDLRDSNPNQKLNLSPERLAKLNTLKDTSNFSLPKSIRGAFESSPMSEEAAGSTPLLSDYLKSPVSLDPVQTQDLIRELNRSTFKEMADGTVSKDYSRIGITNDIKNDASDAFGPKWDKIYSDYSAGRGAIDKIDSLIHVDSKTTPAMINKIIQSIQKQSSTPEGKVIFDQAVREYSKSSGMDITNPTKMIQGIPEQDAILDAIKNKKSFGQQLKGIISPQFFARRELWKLLMGGSSLLGMLGLGAAASRKR